MTIALVALLDSCSKGLPSKGFSDPLAGGCQVAEFHCDRFDQFFNPPLPYIFKKTYDSSGTVVKEMVFGFRNLEMPKDILGLMLDVTIERKDRRVFLIRKDTAKSIVRDTLYTIYLNREGRPDSCIGRTGSDPEFPWPAGEKEYYHYKNGRIQSLNWSINYVQNGHIYSYPGADTVYYDKYDNPVKFGYNSYTYDTTRKGGSKFYLDDFTHIEVDFYVLQYLGYFPEINNPPNIRVTEWNPDGEDGGPLLLTNQQFDAEGRLLGYGLTWETYTITWRCNNLP